MKVLVSGASGYVGRYLIRFLKDLDCEVVTICVFQQDLMSLEMQKKHLDKQLQKLESQISDVPTFIHLAWMDTNDWNSSVHQNINKQLSEYLIKRLCSLHKHVIL